MLWLVPALLAAQGRTAARADRDAGAGAAASITPGDVARRVGIIAADSMGGRDTPSRGLELTAQYVADEFKRLGLVPGGPGGSWFQRYTIGRRKFDAAASALRLTLRGAMRSPGFGAEARFGGGGIPAAPLAGDVLLLWGPHTQASLAAANPAGRIVLWVVDAAKATEVTQAQRMLLALRPAAIVRVTNDDPAAFERRRAAQERETPFIRGAEATPPFVEVLDRALEGLPLPADAGADLAALRRAAAPGAALLGAADGARAELALVARLSDTLSAPNTIGILPGSDPALRGQYVVFSAHMDHIGTAAGGRCAPIGADSTCNGADDDASGTAGVLELAEAFARRGVRPRRSLLFLTVSGEERGLWGSRIFTEQPTVPMDSIVADLNLDMIGRNWADTIVAIGTEHSDLGATLARVNAAHPELRMTAIPDRWPQERFYFRSDHYNFARKGVPILFFFNGVHDDYHRAGDDPARIDAEKESRIVKLVFYLGLEVANAPARPAWDPESRRQIVEGPGR